MRQWSSGIVFAAAVLAGCASSPPSQIVAGSAPQVPSLAVTSDCGACEVRASVPALIQQGYVDAAAKAGVQVAGDKQASLTIKEYADRNDLARFMAGVFAGKDEIKAVVKFGGRTFQVEDYYRNAWLGIEVLAKKIGAMTFDELRQASKLSSHKAPVPRSAAAGQTAIPVAVTSGGTGLAVGSEFEYLLRDGLTGATRRVTYRVDRIDEGRVVFNHGARIENAQGQVLEMSAPIGGEVDVAMPPGGWVPSGIDMSGGTEWRTEHRGWGAGAPRLNLQARTLGEEVLPIAGRPLRTLRVEYTGYVDRAITMPANASGTWRGTVWYSPELRRVVRFEASSRGGSMSSAFVTDEQLELVRVH